MVPKASVKVTVEDGITKTVFDGVVSLQDIVCDDASDLIEGYVAYAEPPYKVTNIFDVILMGFRC